jgi:single-strand DNA-binding protein
MPSLNKIQLIGHLGRDAELRHTSSGQAVSNFSVATTEKWKDKDGQLQEKTEWHRVNWWGKGAEAVSQYLLKGGLAYVEGRIETRTWTDKDGQERKSVEVVAHTVKVLSKRQAAEPAPDQHWADKGGFERPETKDDEDDRVPF